MGDLGGRRQIEGRLASVLRLRIALIVSSSIRLVDACQFCRQDIEQIAKPFGRNEKGRVIVFAHETKAQTFRLAKKIEQFVQYFMVVGVVHEFNAAGMAPIIQAIA